VSRKCEGCTLIQGRKCYVFPEPPLQYRRGKGCWAYCNKEGEIERREQACAKYEQMKLKKTKGA